jgi:hypothetical protein
MSSHNFPFCALLAAPFPSRPGNPPFPSPVTVDPSLPDLVASLQRFLRMGCYRARKAKYCIKWKFQAPCDALPRTLPRAKE